MTGKESLEELRFQVGNITYFTKDLQMTTRKVRDSGLFEVIEKDLEVLEILKEDCVDVVLLKRLTELYPLEEARHKYNDEYGHTSYMNGRRFQIIKEWLER